MSVTTATTIAEKIDRLLRLGSPRPPQSHLLYYLLSADFQFQKVQRGHQPHCLRHHASVSDALRVDSRNSTAILDRRFVETSSSFAIDWSYSGLYCFSKTSSGSDRRF